MYNTSRPAYSVHSTEVYLLWVNVPECASRGCTADQQASAPLESCSATETHNTSMALSRAVVTCMLNGAPRSLLASMLHCAGGTLFEHSKPRPQSWPMTPLTAFVAMALMNLTKIASLCQDIQALLLDVRPPLSACAMSCVSRGCSSSVPQICRKATTHRRKLCRSVRASANASGGPLSNAQQFVNENGRRLQRKLSESANDIGNKCALADSYHTSGA